MIALPAGVKVWLVAGATVCGVVLARDPSGSLAGRLPTLAAMAIAWSAGVSMAFGGALHALRRDFDEGLIELARMRGLRPLAYVRGRVWGLTALIAAAVGGATLMIGVASTLAAIDKPTAARETIAALAYALAFAATLGPLAMATLGTGTRVGGYLSLVAVLGLPELLARWTEPMLPLGWHEMTSIPSALAAVASGVRSDGASGWHLMRAVAGLGAVVAASLAVVWARLPQGEVGTQP